MFYTFYLRQVYNSFVSVWHVQRLESENDSGINYITSVRICGCLRSCQVHYVKVYKFL